MLSDPAEARQGGVRTGPCTKARSNCGDDVVQFGKVLVVKTAAANQFPNAFDRIEFRAVRRQKVEDEMVRDFPAPLFVQGSVMIASVIDDHNHLSARGLGQSLHPAKESPAGAGVEHPVWRRHDQFAILQAHGPKVTDAFAGWGVKADGVLDFGRNPHAAARAMLLEVHFIHSPQINLWVSCQNAEFFYARLAIQGRLWRPAGAVFASGNPTAERAVGTAGPAIGRRAHGADTLREWARPTSESLGQPRWERTAKRIRLWSIDFHSNGWGVPTSVLQTNPPVRHFRNVAPSLRHCEASRPAIQRPLDRSCLEPPGALRGVDGRSAKRHCAESHPEGP